MKMNIYVRSINLIKTVVSGWLKKHETDFDFISNKIFELKSKKIDIKFSIKKIENSIEKLNQNEKETRNKIVLIEKKILSLSSDKDKNKNEIKQLLVKLKLLDEVKKQIKIDKEKIINEKNKLIAMQNKLNNIIENYEIKIQMLKTKNDIYKNSGKVYETINSNVFSNIDGVKEIYEELKEVVEENIARKEIYQENLFSEMDKFTSNESEYIDIDDELEKIKNKYNKKEKSAKNKNK